MQDKPVSPEYYAAAGVASFGSIFPFTVRRRSVRVLCKLNVKITDSLGSVSAPFVAGRFTVSAARLAYLDVRDSCATVTGAFQTQLFINIVGNVFGVTFMMLSAFNALMSDGTSTVQITLYFLYDSLLRTLQMYFIIDACHTTVEQANIINITFQKKFNEFHHINAIKRKVHLFILEMLDHNIEFIIYGFICLNFEMFVSIMGTIATYLLILVQLGSTPDVLNKTMNATNITTASTENGVFTTIKPS
ncbi:7TM chemoreceptor [Cinara cedri]|uniref:7TM chemoreceptor n=1 Tax=Cinara cedri TaxID=506608 RepID=A0A5E4MW21_9HEMI|nr:7TM chemoreceptor [Cinara cedri]